MIKNNESSIDKIYKLCRIFEENESCSKNCRYLHVCRQARGEVITCKYGEKCYYYHPAPNELKSLMYLNDETKTTPFMPSARLPNNHASSPLLPSPSSAPVKSSSIHLKDPERDECIQVHSNHPPLPSLSCICNCQSNGKDIIATASGNHLAFFSLNSSENTSLSIPLINQIYHAIDVKESITSLSSINNLLFVGTSSGTLYSFDCNIFSVISSLGNNTSTLLKAIIKLHTIQETANLVSISANGSVFIFTITLTGGLLFLGDLIHDVLGISFTAVTHCKFNNQILLFAASSTGDLLCWEGANYKGKYRYTDTAITSIVEHDGHIIMSTHKAEIIIFQIHPFKIKMKEVFGELPFTSIEKVEVNGSTALVANVNKNVAFFKFGGGKFIDFAFHINHDENEAIILPCPSSFNNKATFCLASNSNANISFFKLTLTKPPLLEGASLVDHKLNPLVHNITPSLVPTSFPNTKPPGKLDWPLKLRNNGFLLIYNWSDTGVPHVLIQLRSKSMDFKGDTWWLPGGQNEKNELDLECCKREGWEETGINFSSAELVKFAEGAKSSYFYTVNNISTLVMSSKIHSIRELQEIKPPRITPKGLRSPPFGHCWVEVNEIRSFLASSDKDCLDPKTLPRRVEEGFAFFLALQRSKNAKEETIAPLVKSSSSSSGKSMDTS